MILFLFIFFKDLTTIKPFFWRLCLTSLFTSSFTKIFFKSLTLISDSLTKFSIYPEKPMQFSFKTL